MGIFFLQTVASLWIPHSEKEMSLEIGLLKSTETYGDMGLMPPETIGIIVFSEFISAT